MSLPRETSPMNPGETASRSSRRNFLRSGLVVSGAIHALGGSSLLAGAASKALFTGLVIPPRRGVQETTLAKLDDGRYWLLFGENRKLVGKTTNDRGRTW